ncbi:MAG: hypothetical protein ACUVT7_04890 [Thermoplasmata archaeon]
MAEALTKLVDADMAAIPIATVRGDTERDRVMKLCAHMFLRLWTRLALESGQRLAMSPNQFILGIYDGQMRWSLNETVDYSRIAHLEIGTTFRRKHMLRAETYVLKGIERARVFYALEEEKVKNQPVFVNYLVYDALLKDFDVMAAVEALKPALPRWLETIMTGDERPLWNFCKEQLECVGI